MPVYTLTYFPARGIAEMSRYVFAEAGVQYEDIRVTGDEWPKLKPNTPFGKMPYLTVDGKYVAHSRAIVRFLGREFRLDGEDSLTAARLDVWIEQLFETYSSMPWTEEDEDQKAKLLATWEKETLAPKLEKLEAEINAAGGPFFLGKDVSILDFVILPICEFMKGKWNLDLAQFCTLTKLREAVAARPNIAAWIKNRPETPL